jgi:CRP-like cAMP-binding protein
VELALPYPLSNVLIDALPDENRRRLLAQGTRVSVPIRTSLYERRDPPRYVHFLTSGIASVVTSMSDGETVEVGTLGREGAPQGIHLLGTAPLPTRCFMQVSGTAIRFDLGVVEGLFANDGELRRVMLAYAQYHTLMLGQMAGCNRLHGVKTRLARWLLMIQDRTGDSVMRLTQEFLGEMIGSQRTTVSEVVGALEERGAIENTRGKIRIVDRTGLENMSCECYLITRQLLANIYGLAKQPIFDE